MPDASLADWNVLSASTLFAPLPPIPWLCRGALIAPGAPVLCAGYGYSGKSVATASMALSVASGLPIWEKFEVRQGRVLHLDYEQGRRLTSERYQRMARYLGLSWEDLEGQLEVGILPKRGLDKLDDLCRFGDGRALCLVDSWRASHPSVDENSSEVRPTLDRMTVASEKTGCTFVGLHHMRKPQKDAKVSARMGIRGSSGFYDGCQTVYLFDGERVGHPVVTLDKDRLLGTKSASFELAIEDTEGGGLRVRHCDPAPTPSAGDEFDSLMIDVELCIQSNPGIAGAEVVAVRVGRRASSVRAAIASLLAAGKVRKETDESRGKSVRLYHHTYMNGKHAAE